MLESDCWNKTNLVVIGLLGLPTQEAFLAHEEWQIRKRSWFDIALVENCDDFDTEQRAYVP